MRNCTWILAVCAVAIALPGLTGCESVGYGGEVRVGKYPPPPPPSAPRGGPPTAGGVHTAHLGIPPGHLPPPGMCRVWYPGRPPGHQPRPGSFEQVAYAVPPGAWLIIRPADRPDHVIIHDYSGVGSVEYHGDKGPGKGKGKGRKQNQQVRVNDPYIYRPGSGVSGDVVLTPHGGQVSVRVYESSTGVYVGARIPVK